MSNKDTPRPSRGKARLILALLPLLVFGGFAAVAAKMLYEQDVNGLDVSAIPSALIGTKAPSLALPPLEGAGRARAAGIPVFTVALGSDGSGPPGSGRSFNGRWNRAPDPATLRAIARLTGGEFFEARDDVELTSAYADLGSRLGRVSKRSEVSVAFAGAAGAALLAAGLLGAWWSPRLP